MSNQGNDPNAFRLAMMEVSESLAPLRELVVGEVAYFVRQGFTREQAFAIAAAEFVTAFGMRIESDATRPEEEGPRSVE